MSDPIPYELRIGVTGHRDLNNADEVRTAVESLLRHIVTTFEEASSHPFGPHGRPPSRTERVDRWLTRGLGLLTAGFVPVSPAEPTTAQQTPLKLTVISSLAQGADLIVADVVHDLVKDQPARNRYLEAVLPLPVPFYEQDFENQADLGLFRKLLALDRGVLNTHPEPTVIAPEFPAVNASGTSLDEARERAYGEAGRHVVDTSEVLIAIWDPARDEKTAGTGETARYALAKRRVVMWLNPANLAAGAFLLRELGEKDAVNHRGVPLEAPSGCQAAALPSRAKAMSVNFHRLAAYNRDGAIDARLLADEYAASSASLCRVADTTGLPAAVTETLVRYLLPHVMRADHLSRRYRRLRDLAARVWPAVAAVAVTVMSFQIIFLPAWYWLAFIELAVLVVGYVSYRVSEHDEWHQKWLNDRRLAEGLRGAMYASLVGPCDQPTSGSTRFHVVGSFGPIQNPLPFYSPENAWFVATLKRVLAKERRRFASNLDLDNVEHRSAVGRFLRDAWIGPQALYHSVHAVRKARVVEWSKRLRFATIVTLVVVALAHALGIGHDAAHGSVLSGLEHGVAWATVALPAWAAAFHVMLSLDDHARLARRSSHMTPLLRALARDLTDGADAGSLRAAVADAERVLDLESAEWAESLIDRRPEFTG